MRYLTKFQYLNYRKVSLLYIVFILFYFLTGSVDALRHYKELNTLVFDRIEKSRSLESWKDSVQGILSVERKELLVSTTDPLFELSRYEDDLAISMNEHMFIGDAGNNGGAENELAFLVGSLFENAQLPGETPNIVSSTLLGLEELRKLRPDKEVVEANEEKWDDLFLDMVYLQIKSVYIQGEHIIVNWPDKAKRDFYVITQKDTLSIASPGEEVDVAFSVPGKRRLTFTDGYNSYEKEIDVVEQSAYRFAFGQRYYHLSSGIEYRLSLHRQGLDRQSASVSASADEVQVSWESDDLIKVKAAPYFSGTAKVFFKGARTDSLIVRFSSNSNHKLVFLNGKGEPTMTPSAIRKARVEINGESFVIMNGDVSVVNRSGIESSFTIERGRPTTAQNSSAWKSGDLLMLRNARLIAQSGERIGLGKVLIQKIE